MTGCRNAARLVSEANRRLRSGRASRGQNQAHEEMSEKDPCGVLRHSANNEKPFTGAGLG